MIPERTLSGRLARSRSRAALSQRQAAARLGLPRDLVAGWEAGARRPASPYLVGLAALYRVPLAYLTDGTLPRRLADEATERDRRSWWFDRLDLRRGLRRRSARRARPIHRLPPSLSRAA